MTDSEIESFMNDFEDDSNADFLDTCDRLEHLAAERLQEEAATCAASSNDTPGTTVCSDSATDLASPHNAVQASGSPPAEDQGFSGDTISEETPHLTESSYLNSVAHSSSSQDRRLPTDAEGAVYGTDCAGATSGTDCAGAASGKSKKRMSRTLSKDDAEDLIRNYIRRSDMKYAFNKADPSNPPLRTLRHGKLAPSDFAATLWCEQQFVYRRTIPSKVRLEVVPEPEYVATGSTLHRERELEIQTYVKVKTTSVEDEFSVPYSNTLLFVRRLLQQERPVVREVHVVGELSGVLITGIIDELNVPEGEDFAIDIVEFKTRATRKPPSGAQKATHELQVMLYKLLFDDMVRGCNVDHLIEERYGLDMDKSLGEEMTHSIQRHCGHKGGVAFTEGEGWTLRRLFQELRLVMQALPFIRSCFISYTFQGDKTNFHKEEVPYREEWLQSRLSHSMQFWQGQRGSQGVEVEEAWKCRMCPYQEHCWWVRHKSEQLQQLNQVRPSAGPANASAVVPSGGSDDQTSTPATATDM